MTHAVIMAGGRGERLRPITDTVPKPALTVAGIPAIGYAIRMLEGAGIRSATAAVRYLADEVADAVRTVDTKIDVDCYIETERLGTSGCVAAAINGLPHRESIDEVIVLSGDAVCDFDLRPAISYHRRTNADATLVLTESSEPHLYGNVTLDNCGEAGRITHFIEKPENARSPALINTGIYILSRRALSRIPAGESDFARDIFPSMLEGCGRIFGIRAHGYWCDIGSPSSLLRANFDAAKNRIRGVSATISPTGAITSPSGRVGMGSTLTGCLLFPFVTVGVEVRARDSVFCRAVTVGDGVTIGEGCVIGEGAIIPSGTVLEAGSIINAGTAFDTRTASPALPTDALH